MSIAAANASKKDTPDLKMQFTLTGFSQVKEFRVFTFEGVAADRSRSAFTVRTDLALARQYAIRIQELPLLCRAVLERHEGDQIHALTFTVTTCEFMPAWRLRVTRRQSGESRPVPLPPILPAPRGELPRVRRKTIWISKTSKMKTSCSFSPTDTSTPSLQDDLISRKQFT